MIVFTLLLLLAFLSSIGVRIFGLKLFRILDNGDVALEFLDNWADSVGEKLLRTYLNIFLIELAVRL